MSRRGRFFERASRRVDGLDVGVFRDKLDTGLYTESDRCRVCVQTCVYACSRDTTTRIIRIHADRSIVGIEAAGWKSFGPS